MRAGSPVPGLHLEPDGDAVEGEPSAPLGLTVANLGRRSDEVPDDMLSVRVPLDDRRQPFSIYGTAEQLLAFAAELAGAVAAHLDAEHAVDLDDVDAPDLARAEAAARLDEGAVEVVEVDG